jgi:hypothetical protein
MAARNVRCCTFRAARVAPSLLDRRASDLVVRHTLDGDRAAHGTAAERRLLTIRTAQATRRMRERSP